METLRTNGVTMKPTKKKGNAWNLQKSQSISRNLKTAGFSRHKIEFVAPDAAAAKVLRDEL